MAYKEEGKWWVSPANYLPEVTKNYHFPEHIEILDTTLRDGEQEPGIIFTREDKVAIAKRLDAAGVHRIEAGCPMTSEEDAAAIKEICALGLKAKIYCFVRGVMSDMDVAKACGVDGVVIEVPGSEQMLQGGMRWGMEKAIKAASEATRYAHELGLMVTFFPSDASRSDMDFLSTLLNGVLDAGGHFDSVALVDTFGAFSPEGAAYMVKELLRRVGKPVEAHFHEDFGLSIPTTIAALQAGAFCAHVTVNGIGERAGSCPLEPLVMSLQCLYGQDTGIKYDELLGLPAYTFAIPRAALSSSYSLWLHWRNSAACTASRHRSRNTSAPSQKHLRAKSPEPSATHMPSAKSFQLDGSRELSPDSLICSTCGLPAAQSSSSSFCTVKRI